MRDDRRAVRNNCRSRPIVCLQPEGSIVQHQSCTEHFYLWNLRSQIATLSLQLLESLSKERMWQKFATTSGHSFAKIAGQLPSN